MVSEFRNEALTDFSKAENRQEFQAALAQVQKRLGEELPLVIGGERIITKQKITSINPAKKDEIVGLASKASKEQADQAIQVAHATFRKWRRTPAQERADILFKAAAIMRDRKHLVSATMVVECGKSWVEADADTAESIDFLEFYGREALRYDEPKPLTLVPGEKNRLEYIPLGVGVVIAPWNFPNAIFCGMSSAALVTGNTVIMKPASTAPVTGFRVFECLEEAGAPPGTINFVPGSGGEVGDTLVDHPKTRFISFTGSKEIGLRICERAAKVSEGQTWIKRLVAEMGGKDSIVVDDEADIDAAAEGVVASAFGYQGQKCSACSRAIVVKDVYHTLLEKIAERTKKIAVGDTRNPDNYMGAVIDEKQYKSILNYIEIGKKEGRLITGGGPATRAGDGFFIQPTIIADIPPDARISLEEIFGPVLAVIKAEDYDDALKIANNTEYGLTGAVYSKNQKKLDRAAKEFHVGNLYFNRKCTGALVGGHPFGGFNMSGTDSKAGGYDYLLLFLQAKTIVQKT
ncbi:MAG: L-glutamate gamma-semialdehyde dehydrogenase [Planctomycetota bacterium]|jgi:1-pyrroline-5-carboxylate dehydrogenase